jgi:hypothetical protein
VFPVWSVPRLYNEVPRIIGSSVVGSRLVEYRLVPCSTETGELGGHSKVIEEEMTRRLHSDLK